MTGIRLKERELSKPLRVGLIVPSSNTVMEPDFHRELGAACLISTTRILLRDVTREAETRMLEEELPSAVERIGTTAPDVVVFGCTSAGALGSLAHDDGIAEMIGRAARARAVTVLRAVIDCLRAIAPRRLALFTPYVDDLTAAIATSLADAGYAPVKSAGVGICANLEIGAMPPAEIVRFVESRIEGCAVDCIFLSCTNWRAMEAAETLREKLQLPVITSNQAAVEAVRRMGAGASAAVDVS